MAEYFNVNSKELIFLILFNTVEKSSQYESAKPTAFPFWQ